MLYLVVLVILYLLKGNKMLFLRLLPIILFFVTYTKEFVSLNCNDISLAQVNSCKTDFEENFKRMISRNDDYKKLLELTGLLICMVCLVR